MGPPSLTLKVSVVVLAQFSCICVHASAQTDAVAVWVFFSVCQEVPGLAVAFARLHVCHEVWPLFTEVLAGRAAAWHGDQLKTGAGQAGSH